MAEVGSSFVSIVPSAKGFGSKLDSQVSGDVKSSGSKAGKVFGSALKVGAAAVLGGAALAVGFLKGSIEEAREAQKVGALTESTIKATGSAAGVTAKQVGDLAGAISLKTGIDDETIQSGQNMLLTFKNIRNEAGKGNDIFNQSTETLVDLAAAMGTEPKQAAIQLGKALNDPIKGISALSRVGVTFTEGQQKLIESLVEGGRTAEAQKIILGELNSEFGGAAEAQATAGDKFRVAFGNLQETVGTALLPLVDQVLGALTDLATKAAPAFTNKVVPALEDMVDWFGRNKDEIIDTAGAVKDGLLPPLKTLGGVVASVVTFFADLPAPVKSFGAEAAAAAFILPRLNLAIGAAQTRMAGLAGSAATATTRMASLKGAARGAAGIGGIALLTQGVGKADTALGALETTAGAALLGFSVGGPWGAAIGAGAGGLYSLWKSLDHSGDSAAAATPKTEKYADSIDAIAQASGRAQRAEALTLLQREQGLIPTANSLGIATSDLIDSLLGSERASRRVAAAFRVTGETNVAQGVEIQRVSKFLNEQGFALQRHQSELKAERAALQGTDREFAKVPNSVKRVNDSLRNVGHTGSGMDKFRAFFAGDLDKTRSEADDGVRKLNAFLLSGTGKARPNLAPFRSDLLQQISAAGSDGSSAASRAGANIASGLAGGIASNAWQAVNAAGAMVTAAIQEANNKADAHSPSRETQKLGRNMGDGLAIGLADSSAKVAGEMRSLVDRASAGIAVRGPGVLAAAGAGGGGRAALTITNWDEGVGFIEYVADGRIHGANQLAGETARAM